MEPKRIEDLARAEADDPPALREAKASLARSLTERVTDDGLKSMIPLFVRGQTASEDHKCGGCQFRMGSGGCALVFGTISFPNGACSYWSRGAQPATHDRSAKMTKAEAGYVEVANGVEINCASCARYYRGESLCRLWEGDVDPQDCCVAYKAGSRVMAEAAAWGIKIKHTRGTFWLAPDGTMSMISDSAARFMSPEAAEKVAQKMRERPSTEIRGAFVAEIK